MNDAPSGYKIEAVLSAWQQARARILSEDTELAHDEAALADLLGDETQNVQDILARLLRGAVHADSMAGAAGERIETIKARQARYKARSQSMRAAALQIMEVIGNNKLELCDASIYIRPGQPRVVITDEDAVPDLYVHTERKIDKQVIASVLKSGGVVPGASLSNSPPSIVIRVK